MFSQLNRIERKVNHIMATLVEATQGWRDYATELRAQRDAAIAIADDALVRAQANADALAQFQADDAATDAQQLADKEAADAQYVADALDDFKGREDPVEPDPLPEEPTTEETQV